MTPMMARAMIARFMNVSRALLPACDDCRPAAADRGGVQSAGAQDGDAQARQRRLLKPLELDERLAIVPDVPKLGVLRGCQVALRQHDVVVRGHANLELALFGLELLLRELPR